MVPHRIASLLVAMRLDYPLFIDMVCEDDRRMGEFTPLDSLC